LRPVPLVLDTDIGDDIDDLYALCLAARHPLLDLRAVTTVYGDTQARARLAAKALRILGRGDVPVGAGISFAKARAARGETPPDFARIESHLSYVTTADPEYGRAYPDAAGVIGRALAESDELVALVGIGAESNLAEFVRGADEPTRRKIRCLALMGGETDENLVEHNIGCDPEAADYLFNCGLPVFLATYSVAKRLVMTMDEVAAAFGGRVDPVSGMLAECTALWDPVGRSLGVEKPGPVLYDLVPLFRLAGEGCIEVRRSAITVLLGDGEAGRRGTTVRSGEGPLLQCTDLDPNALVRRFIEIVGAV